MAKALAMRCGIVGMGTRSVGVNPGKTSTMAHVPMEIVHRVPPAEGDFEKVPGEAIDSLGMAIVVWSKLMGDQPEVVEYQDGMADTEAALGGALVETNDP